MANTDIADGNGANAGFAGDGGPAADALMFYPNSLAVDPVDGSFWVLPQSNARVRWIAHDFSLIDTVAGNGEWGYSGDGGDALEASFQFWTEGDLQPEPSGSLEFDPDTRLLYISDTRNHVIRVLDTETGTSDTLAGTGVQSFTDEVCSPEALCLPRDVELHDGWLYIADTHNGRIRKFDIEASTIETIAGMGETPQGSDNGTTCTAGCGYSGDGGPALEAMLDTPSDVAVGPDGTVYFADTENSCIRAITPDGIIDTFAGTCGEAGFDGDFGPATEALLHRPFGVSVDMDGKVYISDTYNSVIRVVEPE